MHSYDPNSLHPPKVVYEDFSKGDCERYVIGLKGWSEFAKQPCVAGVDLETNGLDPRRDSIKSIAITSPAFTKCLVVKNPTSFTAAHRDPPRYMQLIQEMQPIFHFARFDLAFLGRAGLSISQLKFGFHCTKLLSRIARTYSSSHGYASCVEDMLGVKIDKREQCTDWGASVWSDEQIKYIAEDVRFLIPLFDRLKAIAVRENRFAVYANALTALQSVLRLDAAGWDYRELLEHGGTR